MNPLQRLFKTVQRRMYDFLLTKYGLSFLCISILVILVFILQLSDTILEYRLTQFKRFADVINLKNASLVLTINYNNLANKSMTTVPPTLDYYSEEDEVKQEDSWFNANIDVVYTWVNGSDPKHLENLKKYKSKHTNSTLQYVKVDFDEFARSLLDLNAKNESSTPSSAANATNSGKLRPCFHKIWLWSCHSWSRVRNSFFWRRQKNCSARASFPV